MSDNDEIVCPHCGRSNFRSTKGLNHHINNNLKCNAARKAAEEEYIEESSENRSDTLEVSMLHVDRDSCNGSVQSTGFDAFDDDGNCNNQSVVMADIITQQADDDWGVGYGNAQEDENDGDMTKASVRKFRRYVAQIRDHSLPIDKYMEACIGLFDTLIRKRASLDTYDEVLEWHRKVMEDHVGGGEYHSRQMVMDFLTKRYNHPRKLVLQKQVTLPSSKTKVNIVYNKFEDLLVSLLTDPRFGDEDFLHFGDNPLQGPPDDLDYIADINTGKCYRETWRKLITKPGKQILVPIIWYLDGAVTGQFNALSVEALKFTVGILNRKARDKEYAWRTLGYVPNYTKHDSTEEEILEESQHVASLLHLNDEDEEDNVDIAHDDDQNAQEMGEDAFDTSHYFQKEHPTQDLHYILAEILKTYRQTEQRGMVWDYKYRGKLYKNVELVFFSIFMKCDTDEADKLCGSYTNRNKNVQQLCRYCCCPTDESDDPNANYPKKTVEMIAKLVEKNKEEELKMLSQQNIHNAWHELLFGLHNKMGIHGACVMEMLHHILLGLFRTTRDCFFNQIGDSSQAKDQINGLARLIGRFFQHQSDRDLPKTHFAKGISEGKVMAKEFLGILLNIAAILQTAKGREILKTVKSGKHKGGAHFKEDWLIQDWSLLVETLLEWEAFLKLDKMPIKYVKKLKQKHKFIMHLMKKIARRLQGMGLKTMKFHGILHIMEDILIYGVPMVVDTGSNESHHKKTKVAARLTQRDLKRFEYQTGKRLMEMHLLEIAQCELDGLNMWSYLDITQDRGLTNKDEAAQRVEQNAETGGTSFQVFWNHDKEFSDWRYRKDPKRDTFGQWDRSLVNFLHQLQQHIGHHENLSDLNIRSEHKRKGNIFRGHPNYRSEGRWNDWAMFDWGRDYGKLAGEIWCFVDLRKALANFSDKFADCHLQASVYAVIESSEYCPNQVLMPNGQPQMDSSGKNPVPVLINDSNMFTPIIKEGIIFNHEGHVAQRRFYLADVDSIVDPIAVIPDIGNTNRLRYFVVAPRDKWATNFMKWLDASHTIDRAEVEDE